MDGQEAERDVREGTVRLYDADDEEGGDASEVVLTRLTGTAEARTGNTAPHQDLVLKRKRPNSLNRL